MMLLALLLVFGGFAATAALMSSAYVTYRRPVSSKARPDYRLIWDLEEELGLEHLAGQDRRPLPGWYADYRASVASVPVPVPEPCPICWMTYCACPDSERYVQPVDSDLAALAALAAQAMVDERKKMEMTRKVEQSLLSSVDQSLRSSGERGFL